MAKRATFSILFLAFLQGFSSYADILTLDQALSKALQSNPQIVGAQAKAAAENAAIRSQYWLDNPKIGLMRENNMNFMQQQMGAMTSWSVSQEVKFPVKYFLLGSAQSAKASASEQDAIQKKLEVRTKVISAYFSLFSIERILALLTAQKETLREIARVAESKYATGKAPQQDEMKAHVEQTQIEKELLMAQDEQVSANAMLNALLKQEATIDLVTPKEEISVPKLSKSPSELPELVTQHSKHIKRAQYVVEENEAKSRLAYLSYAPDFTLNYRRGFGSSSPSNAYAASVEFTVPLWFFAKQTSEVSAASAKLTEAERNLDSVRVDHLAEVKALVSKVQSGQKILEIYETGLIPQATSTLNSSQASYRAGRASFVELLDSERSLYTVRIAYYRTLSQYAENLAKLEEMVSHSLSTLPFGDVHEH